MTSTAPPAAGHDLVVDALGVRVVVPLDHPWLTTADHEAVTDLWSRAISRNPPQAGDAEGGAPSARVPASTAGRAVDLEGLAALLSTQITLAAITARAGELIMLHAAGLASPDGQAVALVGPSGRGKTSAARVLARHWGYLSDETVGCDPHSRRVFAHPKPLSVRTGAPHKQQRSPDELGLLAPVGPSTLERIVLLDRDPGHRGAPELSPVPMITALGELTAQLSYLDRLPTPLRALAGLIDQTGGVLRVQYAEADDLPVILPDLLTAARRHERWTPIDHGPPTSSASSPLRAAGVIDAVTDGEQEAVLITGTAGRGPRFAVLAGVGPTVHDLAMRGIPGEQWIPEVAAAHGEPLRGDPGALLDQVVRDLVQAGVLVRDVPS